MEKLHNNTLVDTLTNEVLDFIHSAEPVEKGGQIYYPGERTLLTRKTNSEKGIPVNDAAWEQILEM